MNTVSVFRIVKLAVFASTLFASLLAPKGWAGTGSPEPRACFTEGPNARGDLENGEHDVVSQPGHFNYQAMQYDFEALSLWGTAKDKNCFRYEVKNLSGQKIESVRWPIADINFVDIAKQDRIRWKTDSQPPYPAGTAKTEITAFKRSSDLVRAYVPLEPVTPDAALPGGDAKFGDLILEILCLALLGC